RAAITASGELQVNPGVRFSTPTIRLDAAGHVRTPETPLPFITAPVPGVTRKPLIGVALLSAVGLTLSIISRVNAPQATPPVVAAAPQAANAPPVGDVSANGPQPLPGTAHPGQSSTIAVNALPVYGTVYVNGWELGDTPISRELPAGRYVVEVRHTGYRTTVDSIWVVPGTTPRLSKTLLPESRPTPPKSAPAKSGASKR